MLTWFLPSRGSPVLGGKLMLQLPGGKAMRQELWELGPGLEECKERPSAGNREKSDRSEAGFNALANVSFVLQSHPGIVHKE